MMVIDDKGQKHFQLRGRADRKAKKARCACGWEGPWRETVRTARRRYDATMRRVLTSQDYEQHLDDLVAAGLLGKKTGA